VSDPTPTGSPARLLAHKDGSRKEPTMNVATQSEIRWLSSLDEALEQAAQRDKPVLLDFFSPT
jgi:hypothetical protein